jgi:hypothetical protein
VGRGGLRPRNSLRELRPASPKPSGFHPPINECIFALSPGSSLVKGRCLAAAEPVDRRIALPYESRAGEVSQDLHSYAVGPGRRKIGRDPPYRAPDERSDRTGVGETKPILSAAFSQKVPGPRVPGVVFRLFAQRISRTRLTVLADRQG